MMIFQINLLFLFSNTQIFRRVINAFATYHNIFVCQLMVAISKRTPQSESLKSSLVYKR